jgi:hypothetical protein
MNQKSMASPKEKSGNGNNNKKKIGEFAALAP